MSLILLPMLVVSEEAAIAIRCASSQTGNCPLRSSCAATSRVSSITSRHGTVRGLSQDGRLVP
jgi:hypothetical protein